MGPPGLTLQAVRRQLAAVIAAATKHDSGLPDERRQELDKRMKEQTCSICLEEKPASEMVPMHANLTPWLNQKSSEEREHYVVCLACFQEHGALRLRGKCPTCREDVDHTHITRHRRKYGLMPPTPAIPDIVKERNTPGDDGDNDVGYFLQLSPIGHLEGWRCRTRPDIQFKIKSSDTLGLFDREGDNPLDVEFTNRVYDLDNKSFSLYINISRPERSYIGGAWWRRHTPAVYVDIYNLNRAMAMLGTPRPRYDPPMTF
jgi:hypothetical protein